MNNIVKQKIDEDFLVYIYPYPFPPITPVYTT